MTPVRPETTAVFIDGLSVDTQLFDGSTAVSDVMAETGRRGPGNIRSASLNPPSR
jgi:hypothetical protein